MARKFVDCREHPSEAKCSVAMSADNEDELLEAVVQHAKAVHGAEDTPEFRKMVRQSMKPGSPPA